MPPRRRSPPAPAGAVDLVVERLGAQGHGVATHAGQPVYLPCALPGERVRARLLGRRGDGMLAEVEAVLAPAPERIAPACPHFGRCGGCALQHLDAAAQAAFKTGQIRTALARRGLSPPILPPAVSPPHSRRRAVLAARRTAAGVLVGFNALSSDRIVAVARCPVLLAAIEALVSKLPPLLAGWLPQGAAADIAITAADSGIDLQLRGGPAPKLADRERFAAFAEAEDLARLSWEDEPVAARRQVVQHFGGRPVVLPAGSFLQATAAGEAAIVEAVRGALPDGPAADLFAGCGTISLAILGPERPVLAVEGNQAACRALAAAAAPGLRIEQRDLDRRPLEDLDRFAAVVFDPPRAGAAAQSAALAASRVPVVVAVSCNPASFARDARILVDGGYRLESVLPVDQFLWSGHVELVAVFRIAAERPPTPSR